MREVAGKLAAVAVLVLCALLVFKVVLGFVSFLVWTVVGVLAIAGALWAINRLL